MHIDLQARLSADLNIAPFIAELLLTRGIKDLLTAKEYFCPSLQNLHNPFLFSAMQKAVSRLKQAIDKQERVLIYGDYDSDGICSLSILYHFLQNHGLRSLTYIPDRISEGYGTTDKGIEYIIAQKVDLLITVDCGIRSATHIHQLNQASVDSIICDHHLPANILPEAYAIVNPHCANEQYPEQILCGAGVVFKLIQAMCINYFPDYEVNQHLDFVALATVADIVPLRGENRILVYHGLEKFRSNPHPTLEALLAVLNISKAEVSCRSLGFALGPCVNAAGRIGNAKQALELFLGENPADFIKSAQLLKAQNEKRRTIQQEHSRQVLATLEQGMNFAFSVAENWHQGIVGLIASKVVEHCAKPAIILHLDKQSDFCTGSARSVEGVDITYCLTKCADLLERFGGHAKAAGLTIHQSKIPEFKARLHNIIAELPVGKSQIAYDMELNPQELSIKRIKILERMAPFGAGNPEPIFRISRIALPENVAVLKEQHIKFTLPNGCEFIGFYKVEEWQKLQNCPAVDIYFSASINSFQNCERPQFIIHALCQSS